MKIKLQIETIGERWIKLSTKSYSLRFTDCDMVQTEYHTDTGFEYIKNNKRFARWFYS
jgi:hypothetical protein